MTGYSTSIFESLCSQQESLLREVLVMAREQLSLCTDAGFPASGLTEYMELLSERRHVISRLQEIDSEIKMLKDNQGTDASVKSHIHKAGSKLAELAVQIADVDSQNKQLLQHKMDETRQSILRLRRGQNANKAYTPGTAQKEGFFLDQKHP